MKKTMIILVFLITVIITGLLYGTHSLIIEETPPISLEQAYMAQYPKQIPYMMTDPVTNIAF